jgi:hypothetical protein
VIATEESNASTLSGVAFERHRRCPACTDTSVRANIGAERRSTSEFDTMIVPTANA